MTQTDADRVDIPRAIRPGGPYFRARLPLNTEKKGVFKPKVIRAFGLS